MNSILRFMKKKGRHNLTGVRAVSSKPNIIV